LHGSPCKFCPPIKTTRAPARGERRCRYWFEALLQRLDQHAGGVFDVAACFGQEPAVAAALAEPQRFEKALGRRVVGAGAQVDAGDAGGARFVQEVGDQVAPQAAASVSRAQVEVQVRGIAVQRNGVARLLQPGGAPAGADEAPRLGTQGRAVQGRLRHGVRDDPTAHPAPPPPAVQAARQVARHGPLALGHPERLGLDVGVVAREQVGQQVLIPEDRRRGPAAVGRLERQAPHGRAVRGSERPDACIHRRYRSSTSR